MQVNATMEYHFTPNRMVKVKSLVTQLCLILCDPMVCNLCSWNFPGKNTGVGCHNLSQRIFLVQGLDWGLLHCGQILYHLSYQASPNRMVRIYKKKWRTKKMEDKCWWRCGVIGILIHCCWECKMVQPLWKTAWYFLSKLSLQVSYDSAISCLGMHKDLKICVQTKNFYMTLCSGTINNCQKLDIWETTQVSINRWMNK